MEITLTTQCTVSQERDMTFEEMCALLDWVIGSMSENEMGEYGKRAKYPMQLKLAAANAPNT